MTTFDLSTMFGSPETFLAEHESRLARLADLHREVAEAAADADSTDGRVHARYTEVAGITELTIDPRALRLPADDLARLIAQTVNEAKWAAADAAGEAAERARLGGVPDAATVLQQVPDIQRFLADVTADTGRMTAELESLVERLSARAGRTDPPG